MDLWRAIADYGDLQAGVPGTAVRMRCGPRLDRRSRPDAATGGGGLGGGKSVADAASSKTRPRVTPRMRAASAAVATCGSAKKVNRPHTPFGVELQSKHDLLAMSAGGRSGQRRRQA